jgi:NAD(P)-dependent dehydrogenase (short-subunit alcohol dehydrogenase family)
MKEANMATNTDGQFHERVALVTGAAQGIGRATTLLLTSRGARVVAVDFDEGALSLLAERVDGVTPITADTRRAGDVAEAVAKTLSLAGRIDILVNLVGGSTALGSARETFTEVSAEDWQTLLDLNLTSCVNFCRAALPAMRERRYGRIVNVSSIAARHNSQGADAAIAAYAAAKGAIGALTRTLAVQYGPDGITCNAVAPGLTLTERIWRTIWEPRTPEQRAAMVAGIPLGRPGTPEDIAAAIAFLASDEARYITGVTLDVNGGSYMGL